MAAINDKVLVSFFGRCLGQRIILTLTYQVDAIPAGVSDLDLQNAVINQVGGGAGQADIIETDYLACLASNYTLEEIRAQKIAPIRARYSRMARNVPGTFGSAAPATNLAAAITVQSNLAGRRERGTKHIGPLGQSTAAPSYVDGLISGGLSPFVGALAISIEESLIIAAGTYELSPIIYHRNFQPSFSPIVDTVVEPTVRTMRRRTLGVGI